ncbi:hypothetical protein [Maliponia aquimaris]|uniref:Uncharacterized protein n=1 Tax=Maliponia aquimaris TaxID=1673631 RepID=A0A238L7N4_9RHOB|nr:hypothetical protein [Maliponia aquimaris]SMX50382.1 hypothetical protein MAA8898_04754 [Maliponia aquimaris]
MSIDRYYMRDSSLVVSVFSGVICRTSISQHLASHLGDPLYRPDMHEIADLSDIEDLQLDFGNMRSVVREKNTSYSYRKTVSVYAPGDLAFGYARIYQNLAEADDGIQAEVYRTEKETLGFHGLSDPSIGCLIARCVARHADVLPDAAHRPAGLQVPKPAQ